VLGLPSRALIALDELRIVFALAAADLDQDLATSGTGSVQQFVSKATRLKLPSGLLSRVQVSLSPALPQPMAARRRPAGNREPRCLRRSGFIDAKNLLRAEQNRLSHIHDKISHIHDKTCAVCPIPRST
jgi:hypothetical protein